MKVVRVPALPPPPDEVVITLSLEQAQRLKDLCGSLFFGRDNHIDTIGRETRGRAGELILSELTTPLFNMLTRVL